ncbi:hypothetical protein [Cohnella sp. JJ-181]|uniref:hypothetical protein n=1 Tax=Cohnella rhizoplanae TaxID=2974897 RepID=UPI0022FF994E|nr:hypothetical protein [Cohnella sp. JJ-181]CAI6053644.1 hypothetical protein COHCIP112018_01580 [Cohnella sp. JJ-181]
MNGARKVREDGPRHGIAEGPNDRAASRPLLLRGDICCTGNRGAPGRRADRRPSIRSVAGALRLSARAMLPFYREVAANRRFAERWSRDIVALRLDDMKRRLAQASPLAGRLEQGIGTNGIGYFVDYPSPGTTDAYATGITIPPGTVQFYFAPGAHRAVAAALLPFCGALASDRGYAYALASAMERADRGAVSALVRRRVKAGELRAVDGAPGYLALDFKPPGSRYVYRNLFFREGL